ncbi:MAG: LAGLIDADG family homing endonuclease [Candidatus ainarchaeum sp.]|nr:LAGLIDADG family homing endonuclease [Candidatus ainarchaeum sp.]
MRTVILRVHEFLSKNEIQPYEINTARSWFPLFASKELAAIAAALMSDGHLAFQLRNGKPKMCKIVLYSDDRLECAWFLRLIYARFGVMGRTVRYKPATGFSDAYSYKAVIHSAPLAKLLASIGIPYGDKTKTAYLVPGWVVNGTHKIKASFLKILFNFDGSLSLKKQRHTAVALNFVTNKHMDFIKSGEAFLEQLAAILSEFGIKSGKIHVRHCKKDKFTLMLFVTNGRSVINFYKHIGFLNKKKKDKLRLVVLRLRTHRRIRYGSHILQELKLKTGTDREAVEIVNNLSKMEYTYRQFEHMRRGESGIPADMLNGALKALGRKSIDPFDFSGLKEAY